MSSHAALISYVMCQRRVDDLCRVKVCQARPQCAGGSIWVSQAEAVHLGMFTEPERGREIGPVMCNWLRRAAQPVSNQPGGGLGYGMQMVMV